MTTSDKGRLVGKNESDAKVAPAATVISGEARGRWYGRGEVVP